MNDHHVYRQKLQSQILQCDARLERLSARAEGMQGRAGVELTRQLSDCRALRVELLARLQFLDDVRSGSSRQQIR
jgi:hypothetical protein